MNLGLKSLVGDLGQCSDNMALVPVGCGRWLTTLLSLLECCSLGCSEVLPSENLHLHFPSVSIPSQRASHKNPKSLAFGFYIQKSPCCNHHLFRQNLFSECLLQTIWPIRTFIIVGLSGNVASSFVAIYPLAQGTWPASCLYNSNHNSNPFLHVNTRE